MRISDWSSDVCSSYLDFLGLDLAGETVAPERVGNLVQALFRLFPGRFLRSLERRDISSEQIGHRARAGVGSDLDASPLLDHVGKVALEYLARLGKRHGRVSAELFLSSLSISPLLRHPIGRHAFRHRLEDEDKTACAAPFAIREVFLLLTRFNALQRMSNRGVGQAWHTSPPVPQLGSVEEKRGSFAGSGKPFSTPSTAPNLP